MKTSTQLLILLLSLIISVTINAQTLISEGEFETEGADPSAVLEIASELGGLLVPRMTLQKREAISNPAEGLLLYNLDEQCLNVYAGNGWQSYCTIRYSTSCGCIEYLLNYGTAFEEWIAVSAIGSGDVDWLSPITQNSPIAVESNIYTQGQVLIGDPFSSEPIDGQFNVIAEPGTVAHGASINLLGNGINRGTVSSTLRLNQSLSNSGSFKAGIHSNVDGADNATVYGLYNLISHDGDGNKIALYNPFSSWGNGNLTSMKNTFSNNGTGDQTGVDNQFTSTNSGEKYGMFNEFIGGSSKNSGLYNHFNNSSTSQDFGAYNLFGNNNEGSSYGAYNEFSSNISSSQYGVYNDYKQNGVGSMIGAFNKFASPNAILSYGNYNRFEGTTSGTKIGLYNSFPSSTEAGLVYGLYNIISNDSPQSKYGVYNSMSNIAAGRAYGTWTNIVASFNNSSNHYGTYNNVIGGSGTNYGGYFTTTGVGNYGIYAKNTSAGGYAAAYDGDVEVGNGFLTVGEGAPGSNNLENSMVRYGVWEKEYGEGFPDDGGPTIFESNFQGYRYINLGIIDLPDHVPGTVTATQVIMESNFWSDDEDETSGIYVAFAPTNYTGSTGWMGDQLAILPLSGGEENFKNYKFISRPLTELISDGQNIRCKLLDENSGGDDKIRLYSVKIKIYYEYTTTLEKGDIAASGLIYSNTSSQVGDLAEYFEVDKEQGIENGLIVSLKPGSDNEYEIADAPYSDHIVGVISENPSVVLNNPHVGPPVALAGRVRVKLVEGSPTLIRSGDFLTTSSFAGKAMKATRPGRVIGYAVTNQKQGEDFVDILVQPGFHWPKEFSPNMNAKY